MWYHFKNIKDGELNAYMVRGGAFQYKGKIEWGEVVPDTDMEKILTKRKEKLSDYTVELAENNAQISILTPKAWDGEAQEKEVLVQRPPKAWAIKIDINNTYLSMVDVLATHLKRDVVIMANDQGRPLDYEFHINYCKQVNLSIKDNALILFINNNSNGSYEHSSKSIFGVQVLSKQVRYPTYKGDIVFERDIPILEVFNDNTISLLNSFRRERSSFLTKLFQFIEDVLIKKTKSDLDKISMKSFEMLHKDIFVKKISSDKRRIHKIELELYQLRTSLYEKSKELMIMNTYLEANGGIKEKQTKTARIEWKAILDNPSIDKAYIIGKKFMLVTNNIWMRYKGVDFRMGCYIVTIDLSGSTSISFRSLDQNSNENIHPHISSGQPCLGELTNVLPALLAKNEFLFLTESIILFLKSYNPESEYTNISKYEAYVSGVKIKERDGSTTGFEDKWYKNDSLCSLDLNVGMLEAQATGTLVQEAVPEKEADAIEKLIAKAETKGEEETVNTATPVVIQPEVINITPVTETRRVT